MKIPHEELLRAYRGLPLSVREYLASGELGPAVRRIGAKYQLHIDVVGDLDESIGLMLSGFINPAQLIQEMEQMGISNLKASLIAKELNDAIFKPLHEKMRSEAGKPARAPLTDVPAPLGTTPPPPTAPIAPAAPLPPVTTSSPVAPPAPRPEPVIPPAVFDPRPPRTEREVTTPASIAPLPAPVPKNYARDPYREPLDEGTPQ